jgi:hypothetical protein
MQAKLDPTAEGVVPATDNPWLPTRGGTQGDPLSTLGWVVFFDILLTALTEVQREFPFYVRHNGSTLVLQLPACYADDLNNISSCTESTTKANCITSAFAGMFGIIFAPEKMRAITSRNVPGNLTFYSQEWVPMVQPFGGMETLMKTLGIWVTLSRYWSAQFKKMVTKGKEV